MTYHTKINSFSALHPWKECELKGRRYINRKQPVRTMAQEFFSFLSISLHQRASCAAARFSRYFSILHFHHFITQMCLSPNLQCLKMFYVFIWSRSPHEMWEKDELRYFWLSGPFTMISASLCSSTMFMPWMSKVVIEGDQSGERNRNHNDNGAYPARNWG